MAFEGYVDFSSVSEIRGWVYDNATPESVVVIEVMRGGETIATLKADSYRPDLKAAGKGNGRHGFSYNTYAAHHLSPLRVRVLSKEWMIPNGGEQLQVSPRFLRGLAHSLEFGWPEVRGGFTDVKPDDVKAATVERLVTAYRRAIADDPNKPFAEQDIWSLLSTNCHGDLLRLLKRNDIEGLTAYLCDAHARDVTYGISQGATVAQVLKKDAGAQKVELTKFKDYLVSLAESLGILDLESYEQHGRWAENIHEPTAKLVRAIEDKLGISITPPKAIGSLMGLQAKGGVSTGEGVLSGRDLLALHAAIQLRERLRQIGDAVESSVCEIGAGFGAAAYYAHRLGVSRYTTIDLPLINLLQGFYLIRALPEAKICLYGELVTDDCQIAILPTWKFDGGFEKSTLLFNQDSLPEMNREYSTAYLHAARKMISHGFLSINQEARAPQNRRENQPPVRELTALVGGFKQLSRHRHWLRPDYVEEFYAIEH